MPEILESHSSYVGGGTNGNTTIELKGKTLRLTRFIGGKLQFERTATPSAKQWREIRAALNREGVWGWKPYYSGEAPGPSTFAWSLKVVYAERAIDSRGENAAPPGWIQSFLEKLFEE